MKKKNIRFLIWGIACLSLSAIFFFAAAFVTRNLKNHTPFAVELYGAQGLGVPVGKTANFTEWGSFAAAGMGEYVQAADLAETKSIPAYYQMTTPNYGEYANLHFNEGKYFPEDAAGNLAVIPESLSHELFEGEDGKKMLRINGKKFTVCGVYGEGGIFTRLSSASIPVIYGNTSRDPDILAEQLLIGADAGKTALQQQQETAALMQIPLEGEINDLGRLHQLGDSILLLGFFFAGLWFVLHLCIFSYRKLMSAYQCRGQAAEKILPAILGTGAFLLAAVGFASLLQLVRIPAIYLPEDNIFDISYYGQQILNGIQQINTVSRIRDFSRICAVYLCAEAGCTIAAVPLFWAGCHGLRHWFLDKQL